MGKNLNRVLKIAERVTAIAEQRIRKELGAMVKSRIISASEARSLLKAAVKEARAEQTRVRQFVMAELKRELAKAKPMIKKAVSKKRKQFESYRKKRKR
jgi:hypothetical protein